MLVGYQGVAGGGIRIDAVGSADEGGDVTEGVGPNGADVFGQRVDIILYHAGIGKAPEAELQLPRVVPLASGGMFV